MINILCQNGGIKSHYIIIVYILLHKKWQEFKISVQLNTSVALVVQLYYVDSVSADTQYEGTWTTVRSNTHDQLMQISGWGTEGRACCVSLLTHHMMYGQRLHRPLQLLTVCNIYTDTLTLFRLLHAALCWCNTKESVSQSVHTELTCKVVMVLYMSDI